MNAPIFPSVGMYAMHHMHGVRPGSIGTLVRLEPCNQDGHFGCLYVPCGGGSYSWPASEFTPVTDPILIAITKWHAAEQEKRDAECRAKALAVEATKWHGVEQCLRESAQALAAKEGAE